MSSTYIPAQLRNFVIERANNCCKYCRLHQSTAPYTHEVDHIIAEKHNGETIADNLALSCLFCNRYKGSDFATIDPVSKGIVPLFNPRRDIWNEHFYILDARIEGKTQIGIATARLLKFNLPSRILERQVLIDNNLYP